MKYLCVAILLLTVSTVAAQKKQRVAFDSYNAFGFVAGNSPMAFAGQTENGLAYKNWFAGAGFGIDNYYRKTLPLFAAIKKQFPIKDNFLLLYVNAGGNFIAADKTVTTAFSTTQTRGGFYADAGVGCKIKLTRQSFAFFTLGNTIKTIRQVETIQDYWGCPAFIMLPTSLTALHLKWGCSFKW